MRGATEAPCWAEPSIAEFSTRPRLAKATPKGAGPAGSGVVAWSSGSARAVGVARPGFPGASAGGISARQRPGEARGSANESCRRGFREIPQKPRVFAPDEILASDRRPKREATSRDWIQENQFNRWRGIRLFMRLNPI